MSVLFTFYSAKLIYWHFQPLQVVSRYRDPQPEVVENYTYLFNLITNNNKYLCLNRHFILNVSDLIGNFKKKNDHSRD